MRIVTINNTNQRRQAPAPIQRAPEREAGAASSGEANNNQLNWAAGSNRPNILEYTLNMLVSTRSHDVNNRDRDDEGFSALHHAITSQLSDVQTLLNNGANVDVRDRFGNTPLHSAALRVYRDRAISGTREGAGAGIRDALLAAGADIWIRNHGGYFAGEDCEVLGQLRFAGIRETAATFVEDNPHISLEIASFTVPR